MKQLRAILECILLLGIVYLIYEIMYFAYNYIIFYGLQQGWERIRIEAYTHLGDIESMTLEYVSDHPLEYTLMSWFMIALLFFIVAVFSKQKLSQIFAVRHMSIKNSLASMVIGIGLVFLMNGLIRFIGAAIDIEFSYLSPSTFRVYDLWFLMVVVGLLTPVFEELFFRGGLMRIFSRFIPNIHLNILIIAFIFSFIHFQFYGFLPRFLLGILLGYVYVYTRSIWMPILIHFINNALSTISYYLFATGKIDINPDELGANFNPLLILLNVGLIILIFRFMYKTKPKSVLWR